MSKMITKILTVEHIISQLMKRNFYLLQFEWWVGSSEITEIFIAQDVSQIFISPHCYHWKHYLEHTLTVFHLLF